MDLFLGSNSDTDISANSDYDGYLERAKAIANISSDMESEQLSQATGTFRMPRQREKRYPQKT